MILATKKQRASAFAQALLSEGKLNLLSALKKDRIEALEQAQALRRKNDQLEAMVEALELENSSLQNMATRNKREFIQCREMLELSKERIQVLKKKLKDRTEALIEIEAEKNRMIYRANQEKWLREEAEYQTRKMKQEQSKLLISQEHEASAINALLHNFDQEEKEYFQTLKEVKALMGSRKKGGLRLRSPKSLLAKIK